MHYTLQSEVNIANIEQVKAQLTTSLTQGEAVELDASEVCKVDTAGMQLLLSYVLGLKQQGTEVHWKSPSDELSTVAKLLGLDSTLFQ
ncbi:MULTISPECIES: STAS domain-containing protein [Vibrio]|mgnify:CR=1 FL=1|uniref:STAS domain-containing protein n=1 Tax=Vibrio proteolyticus NBRC 13287 TaxID=1219065 RepID=U2ZCD9_VIBPR|nr:MULTISPECIES: STAS domain-containing protein [unclassified Vibrio]GAD65356.1 hypothetical protein VPR01S_01_01290 [Vibrio proteolyticus NBRC 13287]NAW58064.1 STAS domain-containing protein [Vibrio sp. V36_P2S2PM302]NAX20943.1 STAS domain-containing protein [Vibrio sp. V39_P1S14PM300]NAX26312.1 STAS domain-containing protein [Vibrio sp. V38_P2S17PM301]NAX31885.1 STAS domain-containing protein [Vibrio sp. V37_P2S8PM304]